MFKAKNYWITVVDLKNYQKDADRIFTEDERDKLVEFIATNPDYGKVIPDTGGVRKIRWQARRRGKRGGARVIYYFRDLNMPVFMLAAYSKGQKLNLTAAEKKMMRKLVDLLVEEYRMQWHNVLHLNSSA
jgi:hypothetical protein